MQGLASVSEGVTVWVQLLSTQLQELGPLPVAEFAPKVVKDEMLEG